MNINIQKNWPHIAASGFILICMLIHTWPALTTDCAYVDEIWLLTPGTEVTICKENGRFVDAMIRSVFSSLFPVTSLEDLKKRRLVGLLFFWIFLCCLYFWLKASRRLNAEFSAIACALVAIMPSTQICIIYSIIAPVLFTPKLIFLIFILTVNYLNRPLHECWPWVLLHTVVLIVVAHIYEPLTGFWMLFSALHFLFSYKHCSAKSCLTQWAYLTIPFIIALGTRFISQNVIESQIGVSVNAKAEEISLVDIIPRYIENAFWLLSFHIPKRMELLSMIPYTAHENVFTREFLKWSMRSVFVVGAGVFIFRRRNDKVRIFLCVLAFILCTPHLLLEISLWKYRWLIPAMIFACILYSTFLCELMQPLQKSTTIGKHARLSLVSLILFGIPLLAWKGAENCRLITSRSTAQMNAVIPDIHGMNSSGMPACEMVIELQRRHGIFDEALFVENAEFALDPMFHIKDHTYHWIKNVANDNIRFSEIIPTR